MIRALGALLAAGTGLASAAKKVNDTTKKTTTSTKTSTPAYNEHQTYIDQTHPGGYDAYVALQNDRYNTALKGDNIDLLNRLSTDAQRVGYDLKQNQVTNIQQPFVMPDIPQFEFNMPTFDTSKYDKQLSNLMSALQTYQGADYMNMDEAIARANAQLGGMYNQNLDNMLNQYNKQAIPRGMFGQMPVEAMKQEAIAGNELERANAINALGANLYADDFNMARLKDQDFYKNINQQLDMVGQQYGMASDQYNRALNEAQIQYNLAQQERQRIIDTMGQYSNDYQAQINKILNDNDPSNDWQIAYLNMYRNDKIANQSQAEQQKAVERLELLGYADDFVSQALGIPVGTPSKEINLALIKDQISRDTYLFEQANKRYAPTGGSSSSTDASKEVNVQELTQQARLIANQMYPKGYTQNQLNEIINSLYEFWATGDINTLQRFSAYIPSRSPDTNASQYDNELFDWLQKQ